MTGSACKFIFSERSAGSFKWLFVARLKKLYVVEKGRSPRRGWLPRSSLIQASAGFYGFCLFLAHMRKVSPHLDPKHGRNIDNCLQARIDKNKGLATVGPTKIEVWRKSARRFSYFVEARIDVLPT